ncbi:hypothetical protein U1Q18_048459, partial [Sarracenia purpurea var. burkii]
YYPNIPLCDATACRPPPPLPPLCALALLLVPAPIHGRDPSPPIARGHQRRSDTAAHTDLHRRRAPASSCRLRTAPSIEDAVPLLTSALCLHRRCAPAPCAVLPKP